VTTIPTAAAPALPAARTRLPLTPGRWLALVLGVPAALFVITVTGLGLVSDVGRSSFAVSRALPIASGRLAFSVDGGDIDVVGGAPGGAASLAGTVDYSLARPTLSFNPHDDQAQGAATMRLTCASFLSISECGLNARLAVPAGTAVTASTGGGNLTVRDLTGTVSASTAGGDVTATNLPGTVTLASGGGNLTIGQLSGTVTLHTDGGDITGTAITAGDLLARSGGGNIRLTFTAVPRNLNVMTSGGDVTIIVPRAHYNLSTLTSGGTTDDSQVMHDYDATSPNRISATTGGGNITVEYAAG
jgi:hypothetical protein